MAILKTNVVNKESDDAMVPEVSKDMPDCVSSRAIGVRKKLSKVGTLQTAKLLGNWPNTKTLSSRCCWRSKFLWTQRKLERVGGFLVRVANMPRAM